MTSLSIESNSGISKSQQADDACPATPTPTSPSKTYQISPNKSPNKAGKELKVLTNLVQGLAQKLKKRDKQVRQMKEKADQLSEVTLRLESTNKSIVDVEAENQTLSRRVLNLEGTINSQEVEESDRWNNVAKEPTIPTKRIDEVELRTATVVEISNCSHSSEKRIDETEFRQLKIQCNFAVSKAKEKEVALAESQAESEELRCQLASLTALLQHQNCGSPSVSESIASPAKSMKRLSGLFKSPKKAPKSMPML
jgi:chromosome segregation ATPase